MKWIFVVIDGLGDLPNKLLNNQTPLEAANTPNLDFLATRGELGYMYPVRPGFVPSSAEALSAIFGNKFEPVSRGWVEAAGAGLKLKRGDLVMRFNFATIDSLENKNILDRRAGRTITDAEIESLVVSLNKIKMPVDFEVIPTIRHKGLILFRGGFSDNISVNDADYIGGKFNEVSQIRRIVALDEDENSNYTANVVNEFVDKAHEILRKHPINLKRDERGFLPANYLLVRGYGAEPVSLRQHAGWMAVNYSALAKGFSTLSGMRLFTFEYPVLKDIDAYGNLYVGLKKACNYSIKMIKKNSKRFERCYIHLRETDAASHDNKPVEKKQMIELIDQILFKFLREFAPMNKVKVVVVGDHSTPCKIKNHTADPVPVLFYNNSIPREKTFSEKECRMQGSLGRMNGDELFLKTFLRKG